MAYKSRTYTIDLTESGLRVVREAVDHHVKALVWRKNQLSYTDPDYERKQSSFQWEINECNQTLDAIEQQMLNQ